MRSGGQEDQRKGHLLTLTDHSTDRALAESPRQGLAGHFFSLLFSVMPHLKYVGNENLKKNNIINLEKLTFRV